MTPAERGQLPLDLGHTPSHAQADFMVGEGNELAYAHVLAYPNWPGPLTLLTRELRFQTRKTLPQLRKLANLQSCENRGGGLDPDR